MPPIDVTTYGTSSGYAPEPTVSKQEPDPARIAAVVGIDKLNPVTAEGRLARVLLGTGKPVEPWTPPAAVAVTRAGIDLPPIRWTSTLCRKRSDLSL